MSTNDGTKRLDSNITLGTQPLSGIVQTGDSEPGEVEVLGYATIFTVGDAEIPVDWLHQRADELGIPEWLVPDAPRPHNAYKRAMRRLITPENSERYVGNGAGRRRVEIELDNPDEAGPYVHHLEGKVFFSEDETGTEGGEYAHHHLGFFDYDKDAKALKVQSKLAEPGEDASKADKLKYENLNPVWESVVEEAHGAFNLMQNHVLGEDINTALYNLMTRYTNTVVPLRDAGAVYFVPADLGDLLDSFAQLMSDIDRKFKKGGHRMALNTVPMLDEDKQREWIQERVEAALDEAVGRVLDEAFKELEDEESTANEIVKAIMENVSDAAETAQQYNGLLQAQLSVEEVLERQRDQVKDEKKEQIIDRVLSQQTLV